jgi:uroporphyrinogen III methyltransferase/synthase
VGAGPGDPGLITRRGLELLRSCDVVLYDRLVAPALLDETPPGAERLYVGKGQDQRIRSQGEIDALTVAAARANRCVVRLKGGDPYVLGRGADEAQALAAAGVPFEVVPGVSSAIAVPSYAGFPLTHAGVSSSFAVVTGHESAARPERAERWEYLARGADTLVFLMGVRTLDDTMNRLIESGRDAQEPAAIIEWGTTPRQRTVVATVSSLAEASRAERVAAPAIVIVGEVVRLRSALSWFESKPLFGRRVVVTRARHQAWALGDVLANAGADVIYLPVIAIEDPPSFEALDTAVKKLAEGLYAWVVFPSVNAVDKLFSRLVDARAFGRTKVAAVGPTTAAALHQRGVVADLIPETFTGDALVEELGRGSGGVLIPRVVDAPRGIVSRLEREGWIVEEVEAYANALADPDPSAVEAVRAGEFNVVTFASASAVTRARVGTRSRRAEASSGCDRSQDGRRGARTRLRRRCCGGAAHGRGSGRGRARAPLMRAKMAS